MRHCAALPRTTNAKDFWWHSLSVPNSNDLCGPGVPVRWMPRLLRSNAVNLYYQNIYWSRLCWFHGDLAALIRVTSNIMWENHIQNRHAPNPPSSALYAHSNIHRKRSDKKKKKERKRTHTQPVLEQMNIWTPIRKMLKHRPGKETVPPAQHHGFSPEVAVFRCQIQNRSFYFLHFSFLNIGEKGCKEKIECA